MSHVALNDLLKLGHWAEVRIVTVSTYSVVASTNDDFLFDNIHEVLEFNLSELEISFIK